MIGALQDFESIATEIEPGNPVLASRAPGAQVMICPVAFTAIADSEYDTQASFLCRSDGVLDGPTQRTVRSVRTRRLRES